MRALTPDVSGFVERAGVRVAYDVYGSAGAPTVVLLPTWAIAESLHWKAQIPVLARRFRVITVDGRGTGRSDRPTAPAAYTLDEHADDVLAVLDATGTARAAVAGVSVGGVLASLLAARDSERVTGAVLIAPAFWSLGEPDPARNMYSFTDELATTEGWAQYNQHAWRRDLPGFAAFFWSKIFTGAALDQANRGRRGLDPVDRRRNPHRNAVRSRASIRPPRADHGSPEKHPVPRIDHPWHRRRDKSYRAKRDRR